METPRPRSLGPRHQAVSSATSSATAASKRRREDDDAAFTTTSEPPFHTSNVLAGSNPLPDPEVEGYVAWWHATRVVTTVRYTYSDNVVVGDNGVRLTLVRIKTTKQSWYTDGHSTLTTKITRKY
eukprot:scpid107896/ scgid32371/ 